MNQDRNIINNNKYHFINFIWIIYSIFKKLFNIDWYAYIKKKKNKYFSYYVFKWFEFIIFILYNNNYFPKTWLLSIDKNG